MELAQAGQLLTAFVGGGVFGGAIKTLFDHLSQDRLDRRTAIRPIDRQRIETLRDLTRSMLPSGRHHLGFGEYVPVLDQCYRLVLELADDKLRECWRALEVAAHVFPLKSMTATTSEEKSAAYREVANLHEQLMTRLNQLERTR